MSIEYLDLWYRRIVRGLKKVIWAEEFNYLYKLTTLEEVYTTNCISAD